MSRKLAEGCRDAWIDAYRWVDGHRVTVCLPVTCQDLGRVAGGDCADDEWFPAHAAPDRCFKPAEPDGALEAGERVYVDDPATHGTVVRLTGWAILEGERQGRPGYWNVEFEELHVVGEPQSPSSCTGRFVPAAACHRAGPQSEPPDEGAVFLGRYDTPAGRKDAWWLLEEQICINIRAPGWSVAKIESFTLNADWRLVYRAALAVARELGLVEAEPERAEPKFQKGQSVERQRLPVKFRIEKITWEPSVLRWTYSGHVADGAFVYACEDDLEPCAPVLTTEQEALREGDVVECIEVPLRPDGAPMDDFNPWEPDIIIELTRCLNAPHFARFSDGLSEKLYNLRRVKKAEPEEERAPA